MLVRYFVGNYRYGTVSLFAPKLTLFALFSSKFRYGGLYHNTSFKVGTGTVIKNENSESELNAVRYTVVPR